MAWFSSFPLEQLVLPVTLHKNRSQYWWLSKFFIVGTLVKSSMLISWLAPYLHLKPWPSHVQRLIWFWLSLLLAIDNFQPPHSSCAHSTTFCSPDYLCWPSSFLEHKSSWCFIQFTPPPTSMQCADLIAFLCSHLYHHYFSVATTVASHFVLISMDAFWVNLVFGLVNCNLPWFNLAYGGFQQQVKAWSLS